VDETFEYGFVDVSTSLFAVRQQQNKTQKKRNMETTKHTHTHTHTHTHRVAYIHTNAKTTTNIS